MLDNVNDFNKMVKINYFPTIDKWKSLHAKAREIASTLDVRTTDTSTRSAEQARISQMKGKLAELIYSTETGNPIREKLYTYGKVTYAADVITDRGEQEIKACFTSTIDKDEGGSFMDGTIKVGIKDTKALPPYCNRKDVFLTAFDFYDYNENEPKVEIYFNVPWSLIVPRLSVKVINKLGKFGKSIPIHRINKLFVDADITAITIRD